MGQQKIKQLSSAKQIRIFEKALLEEVQALEHLISNDLIESAVRRIGAEQELFIIDDRFRPYPQSLEILKELNEPQMTTELGSFNMEFNLDPVLFAGNCFSALEKQLEKNIAKIRTVANKHNADIVLTGILPTLRKNDLGLQNMTPKPRYFALNEAMNRLRGEYYDLFLRGTDELYIKHDSVMLEACNTSFQVHFQVSAEEFAKFYNIAQAIAAPALAAAVNSPVIFGRRLWHETRIAVFQQSTDTRSSPRHLRHSPARVNFGNDWVRESVLEIIKEDIARFRVIMSMEIDEHAFEVIESGRPPSLKALQLHNSTVYRWNRPCYGITDGKAHLRIENRLFPSGPTVVDEVANAAFWLGLMNGLANRYRDITTEFDFDDVKGNFYAAARRGLKAQFTWMKNKTIPAQELILEQLLPLARDGLKHAKVDDLDIDKYLNIIKGRVSSGQTGSEWILRSFSEMKKYEPNDKCLFTITRAIYKQQKQGKPVHEWPLAESSKKSDLTRHYLKVEQFMATDLFTVNKQDTIGLVVNVMNWRRIRHIPVEDNKNRLVGMVTYRSLVNLIQKQEKSREKEYSVLPVSDIMQKNVPTVEPETPTLEAVALMRKYGVSCLPVVSEGRLVGIVTEHDFVNLTAQFLESGLKADP